MEFTSRCSSPIDVARTPAGLGNGTAAPGNGGAARLKACPLCACPDNQEILSRHLTSEGLLIYTRCRCGALHLWLWSHDAFTAHHVARGRRAG